MSGEPDPSSDRMGTHEQAAELETRWMQYTDGSWVPPEEGRGGNPAAGYGVAQFEISQGPSETAYPMTQMVKQWRRDGTYTLAPVGTTVGTDGREGRP